MVELPEQEEELALPGGQVGGLGAQAVLELLVGQIGKIGGHEPKVETGCDI